MAIYLPGTIGGTSSSATAWINRVWAQEIDMQAYEEAVHYPLIRDLIPGHGQINIPRHDNLATSTVNPDGGSGSAANALSFTANTETAATATPTTVYAAVEVSKATTVRAVVDPEQTLRRSVTMAVAAKVDTDTLSLASALTTNVVGDNTLNIDKGMILDAYQKMAQGAKMYFKPGQTEGIYIVGVTQVDDLLNITDITSAQFRGDNANPIVEGWVARAFGCRFYESGNVNATPGSTLWNLLFIPRAMGISFNQRPTVIAESFQLVDRIIAWADYMFVTIRDQYAVAIKTITT